MKKKKKIKNMNSKMAISTYLSTITLNANSPIKRHRMTEWIRKQDPYICCLQHFTSKDTCRLKVEK